MANTPKPTVCVIGAGLSGLLALKEALCQGFDVTCLEARPEIGGQWAHQPDPDDTAAGNVQSSIYDGVILNSCRDTSALPDFPADPSRYGDYFSHRLQLRYLHEYAAHFGLAPHIRLRTRVLVCTPNEDGKKGWTVTVQTAEDSEPKHLSFDALFVCAGHLSKPSIPSFSDREKFRGDFLHSHTYRRPGPFDRKRVALIGLGSSAVDIACELAPGASEVHVVTKRGGWVLPRYVLGKPTEAWDNRATQVWVPVGAAQWLQTKLLDIVEGKPPEVLRPKHKLLEQSPTIRGDFIEKVRTGGIVVHRAGVERFTEDSIVLDSEEKELKVDVVIACTGYDQFSYPFLPTDCLRTPGQTPPHRADLYKLMVAPKYPNLFILGHAELLGPAAPVFDAQARWACAVLTNRIILPSPDAMRTEIAKLHSWQARHFLPSERHALLTYMIPYVDELLAPLGARPSFGKCLGRVFTSGHPWRALRVLNAVWFGIPSAAQWRLFGEGASEELATETVLRIAEGKEALSEGEVRLLGLQVKQEEALN